MNTLQFFQPEITTIESQISTLEVRLQELKQAEDLATQLLSALADSLPCFEKLGAIAKLRQAVLDLLGTTPNPEPPKPDLETEAATVEVEPIPSEEVNPTPESALTQLTPTLAYQMKNGELCAYLGATTQKLAKEWASQLELWGCTVEVRKVQRLEGKTIKWEVKIQKVSQERLDKLATYHNAPSQPVPTETPAPAKASTIAPPTETTQTSVDLKVGQLIRVAELEGEYSIVSISKNSLTVRRTDDKVMIGNISPDDCTPVLKDEPEIKFAFRKAGDSISPDYEVFIGTERIGKVWEHLTKNGWTHNLNSSKTLTWPTKEDAALALQAKVDITSGNSHVVKLPKAS